MMAHLACVARPRPRFEIGDIIRRYRHALEHARTLTLDQRRVLSALALCRTEALGGHLDVCTSCGHTKPSYNSCRNRHCPKCQSLAQEQWITERLDRILPVQHFHVVFTLPAALRSLAAYRPAVLYNLLFEAASSTLLEVGCGVKLGALLGITAVLHTWTRKLELHPHLHCIVTAGGIALSHDRWIHSRSDYLLPLRILSDVFRGKFLAAMRREHRLESFTGYDAFIDPQGFERLCSSITKHRWVVYAKKPFAGTQHVFRYLGRYTHRVGIANSRLVDVSDEHVTFHTKEGKTVTLTPVDFLTRFIQHILPRGFVKIRHFGLYASTHVNTLLERARVLLQPHPPKPEPKPPPTSWPELLLMLTGRDARRCERCGGQMESFVVPATLLNVRLLRSRAPPAK